MVVEHLDVLILAAARVVVCYAAAGLAMKIRKGCERQRVAPT